MTLKRSIRESMAADLSAAIDDLSSDLEFRRAHYGGTASPPSEDRDLDEEGAIVALDLEWVGAIDAFGRNRPGVGDTVRVDGQRYFVATATFDDAALTLGLKRGPA